MLLKAIKGYLPHVAQNMINLLIEWRGVGPALEAITGINKKNMAERNFQRRCKGQRRRR